MIAAVVNPMPYTGKTLLAVHLAGDLALRGQRVLVGDAGLGAGALHWAETRRRLGHEALFEVAGLEHGLLGSGRLRTSLLELAEGCRHVILDTPPRPFARLPEVLAAADLVLMPLSPNGDPPPVVRAAIEAAVRERQHRPELIVRVVYNGVRSGVAPEVLAMVNAAHLVGTAAALRDWPVLTWAQSAGLLVQEVARGGPAQASLSVIAGELFGCGG